MLLKHWPGPPLSIRLLHNLRGPLFSPQNTVNDDCLPWHLSSSLFYGVLITLCAMLHVTYCTCYIKLADMLRCADVNFLSCYIVQIKTLSCYNTYSADQTRYVYNDAPFEQSQLTPSTYRYCTIQQQRLHKLVALTVYILVALTHTRSTTYSQHLHILVTLTHSPSTYILVAITHTHST